MRIGIDIDDTITNTWQYMIPTYEKVFHIDKKILSTSIPYYGSIKDKVNLTIDKYLDTMRNYYDTLALNFPLKKDVKEVIDNLHKLGHTIIFITSRGKAYTDPFEITKKYLDNNQIYYDKLIVRAHYKDEVCLKEKIDLFIDDSIKHCTKVQASGIEVLMVDAPYNQKYKEFHHFKTWKEIEEYIKKRR